MEEKYITEAVIVAELYHQLRIRKVECSLEYRLGNNLGVVDLVVFKEGNPFLLVEAKNRDSSLKAIKLVAGVNEAYTKQIAKYLEYGLPVIYMPNKESIMYVVNMIVDDLATKDYRARNISSPVKGVLYNKRGTQVYKPLGNGRSKRKVKSTTEAKQIAYIEKKKLDTCPIVDKYYN